MATLKWALIGAGDIAARRIAPALRDLESCEMVSVSRKDAARAEEFASEFGAKKWFADWREQIKDDDVDAVYIATPVFLHAEQTIAAAEAGKHVLCEKPMAISTKECDAMIAAARANNIKLGIAYYRRFYPSVIRAKEIIESGEIGMVSVAQINAFEFFDPPNHHPRGWLLKKEMSGGGPMKDFGCHRIEVLMNLFGAIEKTKGLTSNAVFGRVVEDTAAALLKFKNCVVGNITITHASLEPRDTLDIYGTRGSIHIPVLNKGDMTILTGDNTRTESHPNAANTHQPLIKDFADAVLRGGDPQVDGQLGRSVDAIIEEIYSGRLSG